jgi:hypothetical protein
MVQRRGFSASVSFGHKKKRAARAIRDLQPKDVPLPRRQQGEEAAYRLSLLPSAPMSDIRRDDDPSSRLQAPASPLKGGLGAFSAGGDRRIPPG